MLGIEETKKNAAIRRQLTESVKEIMAQRLKLVEIPDFSLAFIADDEALFGRGLEMDSLETMQLAIAIKAKFNVSINDDNREAFGSINKLADFVGQQLALASA